MRRLQSIGLDYHTAHELTALAAARAQTRRDTVLHLIHDAFNALPIEARLRRFQYKRPAQRRKRAALPQSRHSATS